MSSIWDTQEEVFLRSVSPGSVWGKTVPENVRGFAFQPDGSMSGVWFSRETVNWNVREVPSQFLLARTGVWTMRFAVRQVFPASYPKRREVFMLGACVSVDVYPGAGLMLQSLHQETGGIEIVKYRDVYPVLQTEMEELWRTAARQYCNESAWSRPYWLSRMDEIIRSVQEPAGELLIRHGLFPASDIRLTGLAPIAVSGPR